LNSHVNLLDWIRSLEKTQSAHLCCVHAGQDPEYRNWLQQESASLKWSGAGPGVDIFDWNRSWEQDQEWF